MEKCLIKQMKYNIETLPGLDVGIVNINFPIGAAYNGVEIGVAHFLEHIFCCTHEFRKGKLTAQTQRDDTNYYFYVSKNNIETVFKNLNWQISIDEKILEQERNTIKNEIKQFNINPRNRALEYLHFLLFNGKDYGRSIIGNESQISKINKSELEKGLNFYKEPTSVNVIGPWEREQILNYIEESNLLEYPNSNSHICTELMTIGQGESLIPKDIKTPFVGGAWFLSINKSHQIYAEVLKNIWDSRIKKFFSGTFTLRIQIYNYGGVLTLDSILPEAKKSNIEKIISCLERPITLQEFNKALMKLHINYHRLAEDLQSRIKYINNLYINQLDKLTIEDIEGCQQKIIKEISYENGLYLCNSISNLNIRYFPITKSIMKNLKEDTEENIHNETNTEKQFISPLMIRNNSYYYTAVSSPLTKRYHLLVRIDCQGIGRLLIPKEFPPEILTKGILENVRYEGWHTLFQISFFNEESMTESIVHLLAYRWNLRKPYLKINEEKYMTNLEIEMKWRIIKVFKTPPIKDRGYLVGISIVTPHNNVIKEKHFEKFSYEETPPAITREQVTIDNKIIKANFHGVTIITRLPKQSPLCALILQETAFGTNVNFPTLESLIREKGLSYRIVQSLITLGNDIYIFWGIQCDPCYKTLFKDVVREWLFCLAKCSNSIEIWFKNMWAYYNPQNHNSISQLVRDIDRTGHYTQSSLELNMNFKSFINEILSEKVIEVTFTN
ncbi:insulinase family protein [Peribacillus tepidiphilus]|uniref:insulinase family protein n=1 Tax=Peribacillus tepidiphilus TaxID=2652445 RepID=UPI0035B5588F